MQATVKPELIEKESIPNMTFRNEVNLEQHPNLKKQIDDATMLGNSSHTKVSIIFRDDEGLKRVDTTIWAAGTKFICLKGAVWIPINRIVEVLI